MISATDDDEYEYYEDYDPCCAVCDRNPCDCDYEELERQHIEATKAWMETLSNDLLGKLWRRQCERHDRAVDRCEQINSPTIEDARGWMNWIEKVFEQRGVSYHDFV